MTQFKQGRACLSRACRKTPFTAVSINITVIPTVGNHTALQYSNGSIRAVTLLKHCFSSRVSLYLSCSAVWLSLYIKTVTWNGYFVNTRPAGGSCAVKPHTRLTEGVQRLQNKLQLARLFLVQGLARAILQRTKTGWNSLCFWKKKYKNVSHSQSGLVFESSHHEHSHGTVADTLQGVFFLNHPRLRFFSFFLSFTCTGHREQILQRKYVHVLFFLFSFCLWMWSFL